MNFSQFPYFSCLGRLIENKQITQRENGTKSLHDYLTKKDNYQTKSWIKQANNDHRKNV